MNGYEFTVVTDLYDQVETQGSSELVLIKKGVKTKWYCRDLSRISDIEQTYNEQGNIRIHHTRITVNGEEKIVRMPYSQAKDLLTKHKTIGFK